jgi:integrase
MQQLESDSEAKRRTKKYYRELLVALLKDWPALAKTEVRRISLASLKEWAARYAKLFSASRYNGTLSLLRAIFAFAVESGVIFSNPAIGLTRRAQKAKRLELPSRVQFSEFVASIRNAKTRSAEHCADLTQGLAFTGCRISEAARIEWMDLSFESGEVFVKGDPEEGTKNKETRRVPLIHEARALFERMRSDRQSEPASSKVFVVNECQHSMDAAAEKIGMARITHHDLRHFFATICIESGVDIPTVSRWLGHKDGGTLAMRTYGHLRREHSLAQAQKVSFAHVTVTAALAS